MVSKASLSGPATHLLTAPSKSRMEASKLNLSRWMLNNAASISSLVASPLPSLSSTSSAA